jgi:hypothetical protein
MHRGLSFQSRVYDRPDYHRVGKRAMSYFDGYMLTFSQDVLGSSIILAFVAPKVHSWTECIHSAVKPAVIQLQYQTVVLFPPIKLFV